MKIQNKNDWLSHKSKTKIAVLGILNMKSLHKKSLDHDLKFKQLSSENQGEVYIFLN